VQIRCQKQGFSRFQVTVPGRRLQRPVLTERVTVTTPAASRFSPPDRHGFVPGEVTARSAGGSRSPPLRRHGCCDRGVTFETPGDSRLGSRRWIRRRELLIVAGRTKIHLVVAGLPALETAASLPDDRGVEAKRRVAAGDIRRADVRVSRSVGTSARSALAYADLDGGAGFRLRSLRPTATGLGLLPLFA